MFGCASITACTSTRPLSDATGIFPRSHYLESWGDVRAFDGTTSIIQPLIIPLYQTRTPYELLSAMLGDPSRSNYEIIRAYWQKQHPGSDFEEFWTESVRRGIVADSQLTPIQLCRLRTSMSALQVARPPLAQEIEIVFRPDPTVFDGRWANNSWLQELPKPITQLTWDNAALMNPSTASRLGIGNSDLIEIRRGGGSVEAPVWIAAGCAEQFDHRSRSAMAETRSGHVGTGLGYNAYRIRPSSDLWILRNANIRKTGRRYELVTTQEHHELHHRHAVQHATVD